MSTLRLHSPILGTLSPRLALKPHAARTFFASAVSEKQRLVILGSGWGGYEVLRAIDKKHWSKFV